MRPARSRGRATPGCAISAASGLPHQRADRDEVDALLARDREVVDVEHAEVDLAASTTSFSESGPGAGLADLRRRVARGACRSARGRRWG